MGDFVLFVAVGFAAQLIDGAIGMAYGLASTTVLLSLGLPPAVASASVHAAEVFTTAASGLAHWRFGNIEPGLFKRLALPGMIGGALGAFLLAIAPAASIRPFVSAYLALMGLVVLTRAVRYRGWRSPSLRAVGPLGFCGGFLDAAGGGGWGALVTTSLVGQGGKPRTVIGSTNAAEFLVTTTISATFVTTVGLTLWPIILGLIAGGVLAAPLAAYFVGTLPDRPMMILVGASITLLSAREIALALLQAA